jgi:hypothetical protein
MKKSWTAWAGVATLLLALPLGAQQTSKEAEHEPGNAAEYDKHLNPADKHEILGRFVGNWQATLKVLVYGTPPREMTMKDTFEAKWILNEHFIETEFTSELAGGSSKGKVIMGYNGADDRFYRHFLIDWDPRGTYSDGTFIKSKNSLVFRGMEHDPVSGDSFEKRDVFTFSADKDKIFYQQFYVFADGSEIKPMEGFYTRVVAPPAAPTPK